MDELWYELLFALDLKLTALALLADLLLVDIDIQAVSYLI